MRVKVKRTVGKMMNRQVAGSFGRWAEMTEEAKELRVKMRRFMLRMMKRAWPYTDLLFQLNVEPFVPAVCPSRLSQNPLKLSHFMTQRCSSRQAAS